MTEKIYTRKGDQGYTCLVGNHKISKKHIKVEAYGSIDELNSFLGLALSSIEQNDKLNDKLNDRLKGELNNKLNNKLNSKLSNKFNDELNNKLCSLNLKESCLRIQNELLILGSQVAKLNQEFYVVAKEKHICNENLKNNLQADSLVYSVENPSSEKSINDIKEDTSSEKSINDTKEETSLTNNSIAFSNSTEDKSEIKIQPQHIKKLEKEMDLMGDCLPDLNSFILPSGCESVARFHVARSVCRRVEVNLVKLSDKGKIDKNILIYVNRLSDWFFVVARFLSFILDCEERLWNKFVK